MTTTRALKTPAGPPPLSARTGACTAKQRSGTCPCEGLHSPTDVGGYRTCACGHTQHVHAVPAAVPIAA